MQSPKWRIEPYRLGLADLALLSFQRFQNPDGGVIEKAPSSLGALPIGPGEAGEVLLPVTDGEAFWVGLTAIPPDGVSFAIAAHSADGHIVDALSGRVWNDDFSVATAVPPLYVIDGIRRTEGGFWTFARLAAPGGLATRRLAIIFNPVKSRTLDPEAGSGGPAIKIWQVDYQEFRDRTNLDPPTRLDPNAGYKGWTLP